MSIVELVDNLIVNSEEIKKIIISYFEKVPVKYSPPSRNSGVIWLGSNYFWDEYLSDEIKELQYNAIGKYQAWYNEAYNLIKKYSQQSKLEFSKLNKKSTKKGKFGILDLLELKGPIWQANTTGVVKKINKLFDRQIEMISTIKYQEGISYKPIKKDNSNIDEILNNPIIEAPNYDFKQGFYTLNPNSRVFNESIFDSICEEICAIHNIGKNNVGFLIFGVTDKEADTQKIEKLDNLTNVLRKNGFGFVGLEREAKLRGISLDDYIGMIISKFSNTSLNENLKTSIGATIETRTYNNNTILIFKIVSGDNPVFYENTLYIRQGSSKSKKISGKDITAVFKLFK